MADKVYPSWEEIYKLSRKVGKEVLDSDFNPDVLIGIIRGGLVPARILSELLKNPRLYCMKIEYYDENNKPTEKPNITQELDVHLKDLNVLVVDEVCDSGSSMKTTMEYLKKFEPKQVKTAVVHVKPCSIFKPDFYADETDKWIVYPWEI